MEKLNMTVGRFQPFTKGHLNMINEGEGPCIVYQIKPPSMPSSINDMKVKGKKVKKEQVKHVLDFLNHKDVKLTEDEKEILKRPFTNELVSKELDIVKKNNPNIADIVYVKNMFDALDRFNALCTEQSDEYEPGLWMCGDDRVDTYSDVIDRYPELETELGNKEIIPNILKGRLKTSTGKGRTEGVSGTAVRASIINDNKSEFTNIMPKGVDKMFDEFKEAFDNYKALLEGIIKEWKITNLKDYIFESLNLKNLSNKKANTICKDIAKKITPKDLDDLLANKKVKIVYQGSVFEISHKEWKGNHSFKTIMLDTNLDTDFTIEKKYVKSGVIDFKMFIREFEVDISNIIKPVWLDSYE